MPAPARAQRRGRDRGPERDAGLPQHGAGLQRHQAGRQGLDRRRSWITGMLLRHDDPLVAALQQLGEPVYLLDSNPTVERIARLIFDHVAAQGFPVVQVRVWETPTSFAIRRRWTESEDCEERDRLILIPTRTPQSTLPMPLPIPMFQLIVFDLDGTLVDSKRDIAESANATLVACGAPPLPEDAHRTDGRRRRAGAGRARVCGCRIRAAGRRARSVPRHLQQPAPDDTRGPTTAFPSCSPSSSRARRSPC